MPSASGIRVASAYVEIFTKDTEVTRGFNDTNHKLNAFLRGIRANSQSFQQILKAETEAQVNSIQASLEGQKATVNAQIAGLNQMLGSMKKNNAAEGEQEAVSLRIKQLTAEQIQLEERLNQVARRRVQIGTDQLNNQLKTKAATAQAFGAYNRQVNLSRATTAKFSAELSRAAAASKRLGGNMSKSAMAIGGVAYLADDFIQGYGVGGVGTAMKYAGNNMLQLAFVTGNPYVIAATAALVIGTQLYDLWRKHSKQAQKTADDVYQLVGAMRMLVDRSRFLKRLKSDWDLGSVSEDIIRTKEEVKDLAIEIVELKGALEKAKVNRSNEDSSPESIKAELAAQRALYEVTGKKEELEKRINVALDHRDKIIEKQVRMRQREIEDAAYLRDIKREQAEIDKQHVARQEKRLEAQRQKDFKRVFGEVVGEMRGEMQQEIDPEGVRQDSIRQQYRQRMDFINKFSNQLPPNELKRVREEIIATFKKQMAKAKLDELKGRLQDAIAGSRKKSEAVANTALQAGSSEAVQAVLTATRQTDAKKPEIALLQKNVDKLEELLRQLRNSPVIKAERS